MTFARRYVSFLVLPPVVLVVPLALAFVVHVTRVVRWSPLVIAALVTYAIGALLFAMLITPHARAVEEAANAKRGVGTAISDCLARTVAASALLWLGVGGVLA